MGQKEKYLAIIFFALGLISLIRTLFLLWNNYLPDFSVLYDSSKFIFMDNNPYVNKNLYTQVNYPPIALLMLFPILIVPFYVASKIWLILSTFSFFGSLFLLYKTKHVSILALSVIFIATIFSFPFKFTLGMGQINLILLFILSLSLFLFRKNKNLICSLALSLASAIKLFPAVLILIFLYKKKKYFLTTLFFLIILFFIPFLLFNLKTNFYYFQNILFPLITSSSGDIYYNQSISGFFARLNLSEQLLFFIRGLIFLISFIMIYKKREDIFFVFSYLLTTIILINNFSWQHHLVLLLIPYYFLVLRFKSFRQLLFLSISYMLIAVNIKNPNLFMHFWFSPLFLSHGFFGIFLLWLMFTFYKKHE